MPAKKSNNSSTHDRQLMETLLNTTKGACDLYLHGTIESSTQKVHSTMGDVLDESLCMQNEIYTMMSDKGWYPASRADSKQVEQTKSQYSEN